MCAVTPPTTSIMRFAITAPNFGDYFDVRRLAALARDAEQAGWDGFFLWDHLLYGPVPVADPWVALTAIALNTERLRFGTLVTPLPRRDLPKLARETVSLDHLSHGRLTLGVGTGAGPWEWAYLGHVADERVRGAMLERVIRSLIRGCLDVRDQGALEDHFEEVSVCFNAPGL